MKTIHISLTRKSSLPSGSAIITQIYPAPKSGPCNHRVQPNTIWDTLLNHTSNDYISLCLTKESADGYKLASNAMFLPSVSKEDRDFIWQIVAGKLAASIDTATDEQPLHEAAAPDAQDEKQSEEKPKIERTAWAEGAIFGDPVHTIGYRQILIEIFSPEGGFISYYKEGEKGRPLRLAVPGPLTKELFEKVGPFRITADIHTSEYCAYWYYDDVDPSDVCDKFDRFVNHIRTSPMFFEFVGRLGETIGNVTGASAPAAEPPVEEEEPETVEEEAEPNEEEVNDKDRRVEVEAAYYAAGEAIKRVFLARGGKYDPALVNQIVNYVLRIVELDKTEELRGLSEDDVLERIKSSKSIRELVSIVGSITGAADNGRRMSPEGEAVFAAAMKMEELSIESKKSRQWELGALKDRNEVLMHKVRDLEEAINELELRGDVHAAQREYDALHRKFRAAQDYIKAWNDAQEFGAFYGDDGPKQTPGMTAVDQQLLIRQNRVRKAREEYERLCR